MASRLRHFLQKVLFWPKCVMNQDGMSVMISIICVCCTSNCPGGEFLHWRLAVLEASQHYINKFATKTTQVSVVCLWRFIVISIFRMCCFVQWFIDAIVICSSLWNSGQSECGDLAFERFKCMRYQHILLSGSCNLPSDNRSPQLRVSECNPFCWSQHKMCTCCIYLLFELRMSLFHLPPGPCHPCQKFEFKMTTN